MSWRKVQYLLFSTDFLKEESELLFSRLFRRFSTVDKNWREIMKVAVLVSVASIYFIRLIRFYHSDTIIIIIINIIIITIIIIIIIVNNNIIVVKNRIAIILSKSSWSSFEPLVFYHFCCHFFLNIEIINPLV